MKIADEATDLPPVKCPHCGHALDAASAINQDGEHHAPAFGDISVCIACGGLMIFDTEMQPGPMPEELLPELGIIERAELFAVQDAVLKLLAQQAKGHRPMIVKVQRAIFPPGAPALLYDRERQHSEMRDLDDELRRVLGDRPKGYCAASWDAARGRFVLGEPVDDQPW